MPGDRQAGREASLGIWPWQASWLWGGCVRRGDRPTLRECDNLHAVCIAVITLPFVLPQYLWKPSVEMPQISAARSGNENMVYVSPELTVRRPKPCSPGVKVARTWQGGWKDLDYRCGDIPQGLSLSYLPPPPSWLRGSTEQNLSF